jgi:hypothetical protein
MDVILSLIYYNIIAMKNRVSSLALLQFDRGLESGLNNDNAV